ncbi:MAG: hypothetical protein JNM31_13125 [Flavobacteriales bacterium]|nr:hypothetical protein [Flavobacteriales bacterium]
MRHIRHTVLLAGLLLAGPGWACSCFGPQTFCGTLDPPFPNPEYWVPDAVVLAVKLGEVQHGMDVKVLQSFAGALQSGDTVRVWGDCGALCRHYPGSWNDGDTVIWGFRFTDLTGNMICGTSYEQAGEYMISICGVYTLSYTAGVVTGPIVTETGESMSISQFEALVESCLSTSVYEQHESPALTLVGEGDAFFVRLGEGWGPEVTLSMHDVQGRSLLDQVNVRNDQRVHLTGLATGPVLVRVSDHRWVQVRRYLRQ